MSVDTEVRVARSECLGPIPTFEPVVLGPIWDRDEEGWALPENSLGPGLMMFAYDWLRPADSDDPDAAGDGWIFTPEQMRLLLWFYAVDRQGRFIYRDGILQMVKGWGKDPFGAVLCALELIGPVRFSHWVDQEGHRLGGWQPGAQAIGKRVGREPWVQIVGVAREQTKNTMDYLRGVFKKEAVKQFDMELLQGVIRAFGGDAKCEVVTSAPRTMEGNRPSFVIRGEPHHWLVNNDGHEVNKVIRRNVQKMRKTKGARTLSLTNAYEPSENSVAQAEREAYESEHAKGVSKTLYYSVEAPESIELFPDYTRIENGERWVDYDDFGVMIPPSRETMIEHLAVVLRTLGGDAHWLDPESTVEEILKEDSDLSEMRRFYLNSVVTGDSAFVADGDLKATIHPEMQAVRDAREAGDVLRAGWQIVGTDEPIVMFFDGSKSDDSTALVGARVSDGYTFVIGIWSKPKGHRGLTWLSPRDEIDARVAEAMETFNVVAFWADPSHAKDDRDGTRYWDTLIDKWHELYHDRLQDNAWAQRSGDRLSAIMWDMASHVHQGVFSEAVVRFADEMDSHNITWDGHPELRAHLRNARRAWGVGGLTIRKPARGSHRKIDLAVCAVGARMLARKVRLAGVEIEDDGAGAIWVPRRRR